MSQINEFSWNGEWEKELKKKNIPQKKHQWGSCSSISPEFLAYLSCHSLAVWSFTAPCYPPFPNKIVEFSQTREDFVVWLCHVAPTNQCSSLSCLTLAWSHILLNSQLLYLFSAVGLHWSLHCSMVYCHFPLFFPVLFFPLKKCDLIAEVRHQFMLLKHGIIHFAEAKNLPSHEALLWFLDGMCSDISCACSRGFQ